jgi:hypothetical protein
MLKNKLFNAFQTASLFFCFFILENSPLSILTLFLVKR